MTLHYTTLKKQQQQQQQKGCVHLCTMDELTSPRTARIPVKQLAEIDNLGYQFSDFTRDAITEKLERVSSKSIKREIDHHKARIQQLEMNLEQLNTKENLMDKFSESEKQWFAETIDILERNPGVFDGRYNQFLNLFPKPFPVSKVDFKKLLNNFMGMLADQGMENIELKGGEVAQ